MASKKREWLFEVYPDECPEVERLIADAGICCGLSRLHDMDVKDDGTPKKPHRHGILKADGPLSMSAAQAALSGIAANGFVLPCKDFVGACRYMSHFEHPTKYHYAETMEQARHFIVSFNGFRPRLDRPMTDEDKDSVDLAVYDQIIEGSISEYAELLAWVRSAHPEWFRHVKQSSAHYARLFHSIRAMRSFAEITAL